MLEKCKHDYFFCHRNLAFQENNRYLKINLNLGRGFRIARCGKK